MTSFKLSGGHTETILTLSAQNKTDQLASGGEDGVLCLWSADGRLAAKYNRPGVECTSVLFSKEKPNLIYAAFGQEVVMLDTLRMTDPIFVFKSNQDEVNQVVLDSKEEYLAACDDGCEIKVFGLQDRKVFKSLRYQHTNICSTALFRPNRKWELFSGGLDCRLVHWDFSKPKCLNQLNMQAIQATPGDESYMLNPPFIHHISASPDGSRFALALENGRIPILDGKGKHLQHQHTLHAHGQGVSQVLFFSDSSLISGGNDCFVSQWDLSQTKDAQSVLDDGMTSMDHTGQEGNSTEENNSEAFTRACKVHSYKHSSKINWLAMSGTEEGNHGSSPKIFVADQSTEISVLNLT
ncbi:WD repeat-containing protein 53 [Elysia marginata]|uniref:WD repeat-containing protein 53 n=1 Tax=Elysia marginata TaxID=1093978 RepID=A0AAV4JQC1_9GAST|nr:WD repeat-containing protein 53 [Elysia marginata]